MENIFTTPEVAGMVIGLQWGHDAEVVENIHEGDTITVEGWLQWGHDAEVVENEKKLKHFCTTCGASMGPRR